MGRKKRKVIHPCPICNKPLPSRKEEEITAHVEACLEASSRDDNMDTAEVYVIGDEERTRVTDIMRMETRDAFKKAGFLIGMLGEEDDNDVDVEGDETEREYGISQFTEDDIDKLRTRDNDEENEEENDKNYDNHDTESIYPNSDTPPLALLDSNKDIEVIALRARIKQLERADAIRCIICQGVFTEPTVSIICWHVHCRECWLRALGAKRLCPQCQKITTASDLRRIYM